jgi:lysophospholipid acyltransferase (LPLAT)-like uncharacterized protein
MTATPLDWRSRVLVRLGTWVIRALSATWRVQTHGYVAPRARRARGEPPVVYSVWHGQLLQALRVLRYEPVTALVSQHRDGELIARVLETFGLSTTRGSSTRGGTRALLELVRVVREQGDVVITPDGPRGPRRKMAPGILLIAQRTGAPFVPIVCHTNRVWRLKSWDQFEIPKPFARITVVCGPFHHVEAESGRDAAALASVFEGYMEDAMSLCIAIHEGRAHMYDAGP